MNLSKMVRKTIRKYSSRGKTFAISHIKRSASYTKNSTLKFKREFRKHLVTAISAALGFLIALSWREPLSDFSKVIIESFGLQNEAIFYKFISALLITFIAVVGLIIITKWEVKSEDKKSK